VLNYNPSTLRGARLYLAANPFLSPSPRKSASQPDLLYHLIPLRLMSSSLLMISHNPATMSKAGVLEFHESAFGATDLNILEAKLRALHIGRQQVIDSVFCYTERKFIWGVSPHFFLPGCSYKRNWLNADHSLWRVAPTVFSALWQVYLQPGIFCDRKAFICVWCYRLHSQHN
jgi:hypothetical protein